MKPNKRLYADKNVVFEFQTLCSFRAKQFIPIFVKRIILTFSTSVLSLQWHRYATNTRTHARTPGACPNGNIVRPISIYHSNTTFKFGIFHYRFSNNKHTNHRPTTSQCRTCAVTFLRLRVLSEAWMHAWCFNTHTKDWCVHAFCDVWWLTAKIRQLKPDFLSVVTNKAFSRAEVSCTGVVLSVRIPCNRKTPFVISWENFDIGWAVTCLRQLLPRHEHTAAAAWKSNQPT